MYVCVCRGVTESRIRNEVANGATTLKELGSRLGVATGCGKCGHQARSLVADSVRDMVRGCGKPQQWEPAA